MGLTLDTDGSILVADSGNHLVRRVTMKGYVTPGNVGGAGSEDGEIWTARFNSPTDVVVDRNQRIVVADKNNHRLCDIS
jgi:hypothetical protein